MRCCADPAARFHSHEQKSTGHVPAFLNRCLQQRQVISISRDAFMEGVDVCGAGHYRHGPENIHTQWACIPAHATCTHQRQAHAHADMQCCLCNNNLAVRKKYPKTMNESFMFGVCGPRRPPPLG
mmetsp:Transcript_43678/g.120835  ORF Transcript_43678/g.120835 Transcript_43678/m.120835 type:complete len:125 (+) Transcript_43678:2898-3272(+)